ncbi:hypothetical protein HYW74_05170 [Candidatus Pacearchaeota archaeon]|nr:hypothetical protein [Candidatus Pacearchaeota archaeon]
MVSQNIYTTRLEQDFNNKINVKYLQEGISDWIEVKEAAGNKDIIKVKQKIKKNIVNNKNKKGSSSFAVIDSVIDVMKSIGINRETLDEFIMIFTPTSIKNNHTYK